MTCFIGVCVVSGLWKVVLLMWKQFTTPGLHEQICYHSRTFTGLRGKLCDVSGLLCGGSLKEFRMFVRSEERAVLLEH